MLIGEYAHTLDQKGRVNFPAKLLTDLGDHFILSKGLDGCLFVYSMEEWGNLERKIKELPLSKSRTLQRYFFAEQRTWKWTNKGVLSFRQNCGSMRAWKKKS